MEKRNRFWQKKFVLAFFVALVFTLISTTGQADDGYTPVVGDKYGLSTGGSVTLNMKDHSDLNVRIVANPKGEKCVVEFWGTTSDNKSYTLAKTFSTVLSYDMRPSNSWQRYDCKGKKCAVIRFKCIEGATYIKIKGVTPK